MGQVYFVRHGQTIWNVENKICGATDIALTELGHKQAVETGKKILEQGIKADEILYSPLIRAKDTALHIAEITGIPAREEARLKEQNFGKYESTPRDGAEFREAKKQFVNCYEGGESMLHLAEHYGISTKGAHRALADCRMNQQVFELMAKESGGTSAKQTEEKICPRCGLALKKRNGRFGGFWGCTGFPDCRYTKNV